MLGITIRRRHFTSVTYAHTRQAIYMVRPTPIQRAIRVAGDGGPPQLRWWGEGYLSCYPFTDLVARVSVLLPCTLVAPVHSPPLGLDILRCSYGFSYRCVALTVRCFMAKIPLSLEQVALSPNRAAHSDAREAPYYLSPLRPRAGGCERYA